VVLLNGEERTKEGIGEEIRGSHSGIGTERKKRDANRLRSHEKLKALDEWHQEHHLPRKWRLSKDENRLILE
jgi:hypothetical protein